MLCFFLVSFVMPSVGNVSEPSALIDARLDKFVFTMLGILGGLAFASLRRSKHQNQDLRRRLAANDAFLEGHGDENYFDDENSRA